MKNSKDVDKRFDDLETAEFLLFNNFITLLEERLKTEKVSDEKIAKEIKKMEESFEEYVAITRRIFTNLEIRPKVLTSARDWIEEIEKIIPHNSWLKIVKEISY